MHKVEIADILAQIADLMEISGKNQFKVIAYRRAAETIRALSKNILEIYKQNKLEEIPGVGESIAEDIKELIGTGKSKRLENLKKKTPITLSRLMEIEGLGPKRVAWLYRKFKITTISQLEKLIKSRKLENYPNWGKKSEQNILYGIKLYKRFSQRFALGKIYPLAQELVKKLKESKLIQQVEICGSLRRAKETIGDLDILATSRAPKKAIDFLVNLPLVEKIEAQGSTKARILMKRGPEVDFRVVRPISYGAAVYYFTGSKAHNIHIRTIGVAKGLKINEYGVFQVKSQKSKVKSLIRIGGRKEKDVFKAIGLPWIPPELREDEGEIEAGYKNNLPNLINQKDIQGDLHMHTTWSDGKNTILEMAKAAQKMGYKYIAITDHASRIGITNGLDASRVLKQVAAIKKINKKFKNFRILAGIEVDINKDGSLYLPDKILAKLDLVIAAVHSAFHLKKEAMTKRIIKAINNPYVNIIAHPTGRLINKRESYELDLLEVIKEAHRTKTALEINAFWTRLDLNAHQARLAINNKVKLAISTDSHSADHLNYMFFGLKTARRGWVEKKDVLNTLSFNKLLEFLAKRQNRYLLLKSIFYKGNINFHNSDISFYRSNHLAIFSNHLGMCVKFNFYYFHIFFQRIYHLGM